jgi:replication-associated recombination protein RarA
MVKGQEKLCERIDSLTLDSFPRTLMLLGEYGSGKHTLVNYIKDKFNLEIEDISNNLTLEHIDEITHRVSPMIYLINSKDLTIKNENVILKFLEEPLKNALIIVLSETKYNIIPTILNRCQVWELATYEQDFLRSFITDLSVDVSTLLRVANTPGKVIEYQSYPINNMIELAHKIFNNIARANVSNVLTLSRHLAFKNEKDKFDFNLFLDVLLIVSRDLCGQNFPTCYAIYSLTSKLNNNKYIFNIDKKSLFEHYLIELKLLVGGN